MVEIKNIFWECNNLIISCDGVSQQSSLNCTNYQIPLLIHLLNVLPVCLFVSLKCQLLDLVKAAILKKYLSWLLFPLQPTYSLWPTGLYAAFSQGHALCYEAIKTYSGLYQWLLKKGKFPMAIQVFLCSSSFQLIWLIALETGSLKGLNQDLPVCVIPSSHPALLSGLLRLQGSP